MRAFQPFAQSQHPSFREHNKTKWRVSAPYLPLPETAAVQRKRLLAGKPGNSGLFGWCSTGLHVLLRSDWRPVATSNRQCLLPLNIRISLLCSDMNRVARGNKFESRDIQ